MSWCDKLFSVPSAGFELDAHFASGDALLDSVSPIINRLSNKSSKITIEKHESFALEFSFEDGFKYGFDHRRAYVNFQHKMRFRSVSGGLPVGELISTAQPYTTLLPAILDRLVEATLHLPRQRERSFSRVGIVSTTDVNEEDLPPGIARMLQYFQRPWVKISGAFSINITGIIDDNDRFMDRCVHQIKINEEEDVPMSIKLDWQRLYKKSKPITRNTLVEEAEAGKKAALRYFEDVAEGNRFDEEIIKSSTIT